MNRFTIIATASVLGCIPPTRDAETRLYTSDDTGSPNDCSAPFVAYFDADQDGFGDDSIAALTCVLPPSHSEVGGDCDDMNASIAPDAMERCNQVDDDCDGLVDEDLEEGVWYPDDDGDGYGLDSASVNACAAPGEMWSAIGGDCDDSDPQQHPEVGERLNRDDSDCNGLTDDLVEADATIRLNGPEDDSEFGHSLAADRDMDGDGVTDLLVGLPGSNAIAIFSGDAEEVSSELPEAIAFISADETAGRFGHAVTFTDDIDGDGLTDVAVAAPLETSDAGGLGRVTFLLDALGEAPISAETTLSVHAVPGESLGSAVTSLGSHPELGVHIAALGTSKTFGTQAVVIINAQDASGRLAASMTAEIGGASTEDSFGSAMVGTTDINGDGLNDLLVGDPEAACSIAADDGAACGAVYGFMAPFTGTISVDEFDMKTTGLSVGDAFGSALADGNDWNGDGIHDLLVGSPGASMGAGRAHAIQWPSDLSSLELDLVSMATFNGGDGHLGSSISAVGDIDGDGSMEVAIGAPTHASTGTGSGAVFLYWGDGAEGALMPESRITPQDTHDGFARGVYGTHTVSTRSNVSVGVTALRPTVGETAGSPGSIWFFSTL